MKKAMKISTAVVGAATLAGSLQTIQPQQAHADTSVATFDITHPAVIVNAEKIWFPDAQPFMDSTGRTQVPVRQITEKLGATVSWDPSTQTVDMQYQGKDIKLQVGSNTATVDGQSVSFDTSAQIVDGRTFVPLRFVTEALGATVKWYQPTQSVYVQTESLDGVKLDKYTQRAVRTDNLPSNASDFPFILKDVPNDFYEYPKDVQWYLQKKTGDKTEYPYFQTTNQFLKDNYISLDQMETTYRRVKHYYDLIFNVDYRTIDDNWAYALSQYQGYNSLHGQPLNGLQFALDYVHYVKAHKVKIEGFCEPELTAFGSDLGFDMELHYKFKVDSYDQDDQGTGIPFIGSNNLPNILFGQSYYNWGVTQGLYKAGETVDTYGYAQLQQMFLSANNQYDLYVTGMEVNGYFSQDHLLGIDYVIRAGY